MKNKSCYVYLIAGVVGLLSLCVWVNMKRFRSFERLAVQDEKGNIREGDYWEGEKLLKVYGCAVCHQIDGISSEKESIGPPLTNWRRRTYLAGTRNNDPKRLIQWIRNPQEINPETSMPDLGVSEKEALDMATYLFNQGTQQR